MLYTNTIVSYCELYVSPCARLAFSYPHLSSPPHSALVAEWVEQVPAEGVVPLDVATQQAPREQLDVDLAAMAQMQHHRL